MNILLIILIYLVGCILTYLLFRYDWKKTFNNRWTIGDRRFALTISIGSWIGVVVGLSIIIPKFIMRNYKVDSNKPAKW